MPTPLELIEEKMKKAAERLASKGFSKKKRVYVGMATCEIAAGSKEVMEVFSEAANKGLVDIYLSQKGCAGRCNLEPTVEVIEEGKEPLLFTNVTADMAKKIVGEQLK